MRFARQGAAHEVALRGGQLRQPIEILYTRKSIHHVGWVFRTRQVRQMSERVQQQPCESLLGACFVRPVAPKARVEPFGGHDADVGQLAWQRKRVGQRRCRKIHLRHDQQQVDLALELLDQADAQEVQRRVRSCGRCQVRPVKIQHIDSQPVAGIQHVVKRGDCEIDEPMR